MATKSKGQAKPKKAAKQSVKGLRISKSEADKVRGGLMAGPPTI